MIWIWLSSRIDWVLIRCSVCVCGSTVLVHWYHTSTLDPLHYTSYYPIMMYHLHVSFSNYLQEYISNNDSVALLITLELQ